jgi:hypothetical protein
MANPAILGDVLARPSVFWSPLLDGRHEATLRRRARGCWLLSEDKVLNMFASVGKLLRREFVAAWPVFLFFLVGFLLLLLLIKLFSRTSPSR